jgi:hypothetical protein
MARPGGSGRNATAAALAVAVCLVMVGRGAPVLGAQGPRAVGTVQASGLVEASLDGVAWQPMLGGQLLEGATLRTALGAWATLELPGGDHLALDAGSELRVVSAAAPALSLQDGRLIVTLAPGSPTTVETPAGVVRVPLGATGLDPQRTAVVLVDDGETAVEAREGDLDVLQRGGAVIALTEGQTVTMQAGTPGAVVTSAAGRPDVPDGKPRQPGNPASDPRIMTSPLVAQFWVAIAVIGAGFIGAIGML